LKKLKYIAALRYGANQDTGTEYNQQYHHQIRTLFHVFPRDLSYSPVAAACNYMEQPTS